MNYTELSIDDNNLYNLYFACDQLVIAQEQDELNYMIRKLKENYQEAGLTMNTNKSGYLIICKDDPDNLELEQENTNNVRTCKYLGVTYIQ